MLSYQDVAFGWVHAISLVPVTLQDIHVEEQPENTSPKSGLARAALTDFGACSQICSLPAHNNQTSLLG